MSKRMTFSMFAIILTVCIIFIFATSKAQIKEISDIGNYPYLLKAYGNNAALYKDGSILKIYDEIYLDMLPDGDRKRLEDGITAKSMEEIFDIIQDYDG